MTNPFTQQQPAAQPQQQGNPFAPGVPAAPAPVAQPQYGNAYGVAPGAQHAPTVYGGPQQAAPAPVAASPPPALDRAGLQSAGAPVIGEGRGAKLPDMYGRLALFFPLALTRVPRNPQYITPEQRQRGDVEQDQMTATVVVLDDGQGGMQPIAYGGNIAAFPPVPNTESAPLPYVRKGMWIKQSRLISQLRDALPAPGGAPRMRLGRVVKAGPEHNAPWFLQGATEQELGLANQYLELVQGGTYPHPLA